MHIQSVEIFFMSISFRRRQFESNEKEEKEEEMKNVCETTSAQAHTNTERIDLCVQNWHILTKFTSKKPESK